jgi:hypothetical protein
VVGGSVVQLYIYTGDEHIQCSKKKTANNTAAV